MRPPLLDHLEFTAGLCRLRLPPLGSLVEAVALVSASMALCRDRKISKLLINVCELRGVPQLDLVARFLLTEQWPVRANPLTVAVVARSEQIRSWEFGVNVATESGLKADVFESEPEALEWLLVGQC